MYRYLLFIVFSVLCVTNSVSAATETARFYSDVGSDGVTTDGRMFEDRYSDWIQTIDSESARITSMLDNGQDVSNYLGSGYGPNYYGNNRLHFGFDTAQIPDDALIKSATFFVHSAHIDQSNGTERRIYLVGSSPSTNNTLIVSDYSKVGNVSLGVTDGTWSIEEYHSIPLNNEGIQWVNKKGVTNFALRGWYDFNHVAPTDTDELLVYVYFADAYGTTSDPYLEVTYDVPDTVVEKDMYDYLHELIEAVEGYGLRHNIERSYMAHLGKVEKFLKKGKYTPAVEQVEVFMKKLKQDVKAKKISREVYADLYGRAEVLLEVISDVRADIDSCDDGGDERGEESRTRRD